MPAYTPTTWENDVTAINETRLNNIEGGVDGANQAIDDHLADSTDAHDASAISIADAGNYFTGTQVEAALQELGAASGGGGGGAELDLVTWTTTEIVLGTDTLVVESGTVTLDGSTDIIVGFFCPLVAGNAIINLELFYDPAGGSEVSVGYFYTSAQFSSYGSNPAVFVEYPLVGLAADDYVFRVKGTSSAGSVYAGAGGANTRVPGYLRIRSV